MTAAASLFVVLALVAAVADWVAAHRGITALEYVAKPAVMVFLVLVALTVDATSGPARILFVLALLFSLAGDVFLMLPDRKRWFVFGLASFLLGHLCYVPGLWVSGVQLGSFGIGVVVVVVGAGIIGMKVLDAVKADRPKLVVPVQAYMGVLGLMTASAIGTTKAAAVVGGVLFFSSDSILSWNEFVRPVPLAKILIHVTYHLGQLGLVLALI